MSWFWRCKEHSCPLSPLLGLLRMLEVPDCGLISWSWFEYNHWSLVDQCSEFWLFILMFECAKTICAPKVHIWGFGGHWSFLTGVLHLDFDLDMVTGLCFTHVPKFLLFILNLKVQRYSMSVKSLFGYYHWSVIDLCSKFWLSILILKVQRRFMSSKSCLGAMEDAWGSWLEFGILILIWKWSLVFDIPMIWILALFPDF